jgi:hypothetical protein
MEGILSLVRKLQRACTALADNGVESALPADWDALPSIAVVGDQVRILLYCSAAAAIPRMSVSAGWDAVAACKAATLVF